MKILKYNTAQEYKNQILKEIAGLEGIISVTATFDKDRIPPDLLALFSKGMAWRFTSLLEEIEYFITAYDQQTNFEWIKQELTHYKTVYEILPLTRLALLQGDADNLAKVGFGLDWRMKAFKNLLENILLKENKKMEIAKNNCVGSFSDWICEELSNLKSIIGITATIDPDMAIKATDIMKAFGEGLNWRLQTIIDEIEEYCSSHDKKQDFEQWIKPELDSYQANLLMLTLIKPESMLEGDFMHFGNGLVCRIDTFTDKLFHFISETRRSKHDLAMVK